jgi:non-ribosomal peptide synthetase-like protein
VTTRIELALPSVNPDAMSKPPTTVPAGPEDANATLPVPAIAAVPSSAGAPVEDPPARTLLDIFDETVARFGGRPAIDAPDATLTYRELAEAADALAARLAARGIAPGDRVGIQVASGTAELYVAILGVLRAGAAYVPVDADDPPARARDIFTRARACAVVGDGLAIADLADPGSGERAAAAGGPYIEDDAWIIFTSGSTGAPKGVAVTHRAAAAFVDAEARLWSVVPEDRVLAALSVGFDASCEEIWLAWRNGATLVPAPRALVRAGAELGDWIARRRITVVSTVPTLAAMWEEASLARVRLLVLGGEACPEGLAWRLAKEREVWNTYGPTEATVVSTGARVRPGEPVTIGWPLHGWRTAIIDEDGRSVPIGEPGELVIAGVGLARYLDQELDAQRFSSLPELGFERAYRTGDIVRETIDGLQFVGRRDDQVKIGGRRIELGEIDACLSEAPGVRAALCGVRESASGNRLLVGYVVGEVDPRAVRAFAAERLPAGVVPQVVVLDSLPRGRSGKVDRSALPWPPPPDRAILGGSPDGSLGPTAAWLAQRWAEQLGTLPPSLESDFFELGGGSLAAAKLVSALRERFPTVAVADVYNHRRLGELSAQLDRLGEGGADEQQEGVRPRRGWASVQLGGVLAVMVAAAPQWILGTLLIDRLYPGNIGPKVGWAWLIGGWLALGSRPGRALIVAGLRRVLLRGLRPGRYSRHSFLALRVWLLERLADIFHLDGLAGTPWAARYARLVGHDIAPDARLGTLPSPTSLVTIGEGATLEEDVDLRGWWIDGRELVVGRVQVGPHARVGARALLMPGAIVGARAEVEPGSVVEGEIPSGERWGGSPARRAGTAGAGWPAAPAPAARGRRAWKALYGVGLFADALLALLAAAPGIAMILLLAPHGDAGPSAVVMTALELAPAATAAFVLAYALLVALSFRAVSRLVRPGWHPADGGTAWGLWFGESLMATARDVLFPLYSSIFVAPWLRLAGISVGRRAEISTAVGLTRLASFADKSFAADDVVFAGTRSREGWLHVEGIAIGEHSFLGNGAILTGGTRIGERSLVGVLTTPPREPAAETSWFGSPALELPRLPDRGDPARTTDPPARLVAARGLMELIRILLPASISAVLGSLAFLAMDVLGNSEGVAAMAAAAPLLLLGAGLLAALVTVACKWLIIGRYRAGEHPLWSFFVWRDEIVNSCQELIAGTWLLDAAMGTPLLSLYLRLMGARVGRDVWCETLTITEFELARLEDGCAVNRHAVVETHLFHDRLMRIGPATLGAHATLGPSSAMLPDTVIGAGCTVGGRSVVMRGEELPPMSRWHGSPVTAAP